MFSSLKLDPMAKSWFINKTLFIKIANCLGITKTLKQFYFIILYFIIIISILFSNSIIKL